MKESIIRILLVDDDEDIYSWVRDMLVEAESFTWIQNILVDAEAVKFDLEWVSTYKEGLDKLKKSQYQLYLLDYRLGEQNGLELLNEAVEGGCREPIIMLTGQGDLSVDYNSMKMGAVDYLNKYRLNAELLERTIRYALERKRLEEDREKLFIKLKNALASVKKLSGLLPICASCKKIRDDKGYWQNVEEYIHNHSEADFSHGICPDCSHNLYPFLYEKENK